jgi:Carboxypeptidase regulatory-like domain
MSNRNGKRLAAVMMLSLAAAFAQPQQQPQAPPTGNGVFSGVVTNSATGAGVPRAQVSLFVIGSTGGQNFPTVTDAEGKFTIGNLPRGRLIVNVGRLGFVAPSSGNQLFDMQLRPNEKKENVKLTLTPTGAISGRVLNAEGAVQGAIVSLDGIVPGASPATTDEKGQFRISGVPPGRYRLVANPAVMPFPPEIRTDGTREVHYARTYYPDALTVKTGQRVEIAAGMETPGMDIHLVQTPVVTLSGKVMDAPAGGKTQVRAVASAATGGGIQMAGYVKADGSFQIWQLDPGKYTLVATNTSQGPGMQHGVQSTPVEVEVAGHDIERIDLRMLQPFDVSVQVRFDDAKAREMPTMQQRQMPGQPPPQQAPPAQTMPRRVMLRPEGQTFVPMTQSMFQPIEIGADDSFTLQGLAPMRYRLAPAWAVYVKSVTVGDVETAGDILDLRNGPGGAVTVTLASVTGEVSGVVSDSSGPAAGVRVILVSTAGRLPMGALSDPDGAYKFASVPPGSYKLIAPDNEAAIQFNMARELPEDYVALADSVEVHGGDTVTKPLRKLASGGK